jgi:fructose/tagatose bisphosphate aldolase
MQALRDVLEQTQKNEVAMRHFNIADSVLLKAVLTSAQELKVPVLVGASEGEREFIGVRQIATLVRSLREEFDFLIFLNADHTHSLAKATSKTYAKPKRRSKPSKQSMLTSLSRERSATSEPALKYMKRFRPVEGSNNSYRSDAVC